MSRPCLLNGTAHVPCVTYVLHKLQLVKVKQINQRLSLMQPTLRTFETRAQGRVSKRRQGTLSCKHARAYCHQNVPKHFHHVILETAAAHRCCPSVLLHGASIVIPLLLLLHTKAPAPSSFLLEKGCVCASARTGTNAGILKTQVPASRPQWQDTDGGNRLQHRSG